MAGKSFGDDIENFAIDFIDGSEETIRAAAISTWPSIIASSPVFEGRFRANWQASGLTIPSGNSTKTDKSGNATSNAVTASVKRQVDWSEFNLTNNLPYSNVIEYGLYGDGPNTVGGYSTQAPSGVVRVNIARIKANFDAIAKKRLPK